MSFTLPTSTFEKKLTLLYHAPLEITLPGFRFVLNLNFM